MKRLVVLLTAVLFWTPLMAVDFGLDLHNISAFMGSDAATFSQRDSATAWFSATGTEWQVKIEGFYKFSGDFGVTRPADYTVVPYRFDLGNVYFQAQFPGLLGANTLSMLQIGRFHFEDPSTNIINGMSDGLAVRWLYNTLEVSVHSGFTGLTAQQDANIVISAADFQDNLDQTSTNFLGVHYFAPNRIFVDLKAKVLEFVDRHDISLDVIGQFDLRATDPMHTGYAELAAEGRPLQFFKWRLYAIGELWGDAATNVSMAAGGRAQLSFPELLGLVAIANLDWASGSEKPFRQFCPINQGQVAQIYEAVFADTLTANLNLAIRPTQGLVIGASGYGIMRASSNAPVDVKWPVAASSPYLGTEALLNVNYTYGSELSLGLKGGAFFPNTSTDAYGAAALPRWMGSFEFKLSL